MPESKSLYVLSPQDSRSVELLRASLAAADDGIAFCGVGRSMQPSLQPGDQLKIVKIRDRVRCGWIVVVPWKGGIVTHRVIRASGSQIWTRGDAGGAVEGPIDVNQVIGRITAYSRFDEWCSVTGVSNQVMGLVTNAAMTGARWAKRRWPRLGSLVELDLLATPCLRHGYRWIGRKVLGVAEISEDRNPKRAIGALVSNGLPLTQPMVTRAEKSLACKDLRIFVARSSRVNPMGTALVEIERSIIGSPTARVALVRVRLGCRGMGIGRLLLLTVEQAAKEAGLKTIVADVPLGDRRGMAFFSASGYRQGHGAGPDGSCRVTRELTDA